MYMHTSLLARVNSLSTHEHWSASFLQLSCRPKEQSTFKLGYSQSKEFTQFDTSVKGDWAIYKTSHRTDFSAQR